MDITGTNSSPSFIPKKPLVERSNLSANIPGILLFLSVAALIISVGGYFMAIFQLDAANKDVVNLNNTLKKAQDQFQPNQVINMTRFDSKLKIAEDLLYLNKNPGASDSTMHITLQPLFKLLSDQTLQAVRFKDFKYTNVDNQKIDIKMSGEAKSSGSVANYAAIAQQARAFSDTRELTNVIVSDLNLGADNNVIFNLSASAKPELLSYTEALSQ